MDLGGELSDCALKIREQYSVLETKKYGKQWSPPQIMVGFGQLSYLPTNIWHS